jgi:hypothetical protein
MAELPATISSGAIMSATPSNILVSMDVDGGHVKIDWTEVEKQATGRDSYLRPLAKALLAVRDKTWEPIKHAAPPTTPQQ